MTADSWIIDALGEDRVRLAEHEAGRRRLLQSLRVAGDSTIPDPQLRFVANALELHVFDLLDAEDPIGLRVAAADAFQLARVLELPETPLEAAEALVRLGCLGVIGERVADVRRLLVDSSVLEALERAMEAQDWGQRVRATLLHVWLRAFRQDGWDDLDAVLRGVVGLRSAQGNLEREFLNQAEERRDAQPAWQLISDYHLARAAELFGEYQSQGSVEDRFDIQQQLEAQFDRAIHAAARGRLMERETFARLLAPTASTLVANSIWTVTRAVNSRVSKFVKSLTSRARHRPILTMLPPQRYTLRERGLLGSGHRSVVVGLPTSGGKTLIAEFRILQALNQFDHEQGWVAYVAPTRALVNQVVLSLRRDFGGVGIAVEKVSPALEIDGREAAMLLENDSSQQFRVLITTPEKLDLMLRAGWEERIGRPLTLVVVDEAHGIGADERGLKLELLLATINRDCRYAQFLLLTPFVPNAAEISRWLDPESNASIELELDWLPNDRAIAIACPKRGDRRGDFSIEFLTQHTTRKTIKIPESVQTADHRPLGLSWSEVARSPSMLAAATASVLQHRGTVVVLVQKPQSSWGVARAFQVADNRLDAKDGDLRHIQRFLADEMGSDFPLVSLLDYGIGVHHAGLSEDTRAIIEWLTERSKLRVLVATTTLAQGVNFPVSGVVFASHQHPYGKDLTPEEFWNIAGRAGRVDQEDLGIVALAGPEEARVEALESFVGRSVSALNSTLIEMVQKAVATDEDELLQLHKIAWQPEWSAFLQYLAHTYRQIGNHERFATEVEQVLRGTLGFRSLRKSHKGWADALVRGVYNYAERIKGKPLKLVDATGFSWESVSRTLARIDEAKLTRSVWSPEIFESRRTDLNRMMGVLLEVPELRGKLKEVVGGAQPDGDKLARITCDWVHGRALSEMARDYFGRDADKANDRSDQGDPAAMTRCCRMVFGRLTQTVSWGLAALQSLTFQDSIDSLSEADQRMVRNLPARVYYGVNSDEAVALRLLGVPRSAAEALARRLDVGVDEPLHALRTRVARADASQWTAALGEIGASYHRVWSILQGEA